MAKMHDLKIWPSYFEAVMEGRKRFELRVNDRDFAVGDTLLLREWDPAGGYAGRDGCYTGSECQVSVTFVAQGVFGLPPNLCVMSIEVSPPQREETR